MCDENDNEQEGKVAPSKLDLHGRASEEHPEAKENLDSPAKVIVESLKPFVNGHYLPAADVPAAVDEVECSRVDTHMPSSTNVDVADSQQCSVEHNCESSEAAAPLYTENEAIADENVEVLDNLIRSAEPICESVEGSAEPIRASVEGSVGPIDQCVEGFVGPINQSVEGSVEPSHESVEPFMDPIYESVEATISVERKDEVTVDENGGTTELAWQESEVNDSICNIHICFWMNMMKAVCLEQEQQSSFNKELEKFFKERNMEFKPPKFYGEGLNCLK